MADCRGRSPERQRTCGRRAPAKDDRKGALLRQSSSGLVRRPPRRQFGQLRQSRPAAPESGLAASLRRAIATTSGAPFCCSLYYFEARAQHKQEASESEAITAPVHSCSSRRSALGLREPTDSGVNPPLRVFLRATGGRLPLTARRALAVAVCFLAAVAALLCCWQAAANKLSFVARRPRWCTRLRALVRS